MKDRIGNRPNRFKITPESGGSAYYITLERADEPIEIGTPYDKASVLKDSTCNLLGIPTTSVPDDAFARIATKVAMFDTTGNITADIITGNKIIGAVYQ